jgi:UDP-N-acetylglucosamine--N-acetylmuramyl-(pentapeptide) pyrophosphoryl-undecaprenol N-acetylglucosamine transferase
MTLTEIAKMGKASVIVPSPTVADNHQYKNAKVLADANAAVMICENEMKVDGICKVCEAVERFYEDTELRERMSENIRAFAKPDVEKAIFEVIRDLVESK